MTECWDVVIVGGGPAGSTAAGYLARLGYRTLLLERHEFPRHRIGESLLPSMMPVLEDFGLVDACRQAGFIEKSGATFIWGKSRDPWDLRFGDAPFLPASFAFHVERSVFDQILLDSARRRGATIRLKATVLGAIRDGDRVVGVTYRDEDTGKTKSVYARFVVDASGAASVLGRRLTTRHYDDQMRQIALYSYFRDVRGPPAFRDRQIIIESCPKGWFWFIPMNSERLGQASVGLVTGREFDADVRHRGIQAFYEDALSESPHVKELVGTQAVRVDKVHTVRDWAYSCDVTAGPGYYLAGDAAAFLDPLLSTGVSLAMLAGYSASVCIHSALTDPAMEAPAAAFFSDNYRQMYEVTRDFLHYFYAGNATAHPDDLFWEARRILKCDDNLGAKQAFAFFINTIPGNPHPAIQKQIPMFHMFMDNLDHSVNTATGAFGASTIADGSFRRADTVHDADIPIVNGTVEQTWRFNSERHMLEPVRGVAFDRERPVFSSTSSWLLGRNLAPLADEACDLLSVIDGETPWALVVSRYSRLAGLPLERGREAAMEIVLPLLAQDYLLVRTAAGGPGEAGAREGACDFGPTCPPRPPVCRDPVMPCE